LDVCARGRQGGTVKNAGAAVINRPRFSGILAISESGRGAFCGLASVVAG
jgi:hypothetical protein